MHLRIKAFLRNDDGATAIEYSLIITLIAVAVIGGAKLIGPTLAGTFNNLAGNVGSH